MNLLTAAHRDDELDTGVVEGELVYPCLVHDLEFAVETGVLCPCGCAVSFGGLVTGRATSVAICRDLDLDEAELLRLVVEYFQRTGERATVDDEVLDLAVETAGQMTLVGRAFQPGDLVYRVGTRFTSRERPTRGLEHLRVKP